MLTRMPNYIPAVDYSSGGPHEELTLLAVFLLRLGQSGMHVDVGSPIDIDTSS